MKKNNLQSLKTQNIEQMKSNLFKYTYIASFVITLFFNNNTVAQELDASNYKYRFSINTTKQSDNSRLLEASFIGVNKKDRKDKIPVYEAEIAFYNVLNEEKVLLGKSKTSKEGLAQLSLSKNQLYLTDNERRINLLAHFEETDGLAEEEDEISVKDINLSFDLTEIDSVRTVVVKAFMIDSLGVENPVLETDLFIAVGSMLSKMKIEEGTIEDGEFEYEFPTDIPGDANGDVTVYTLIEDSDEFGNVVQEKKANWGTFDKQISEDKNTLWSEVAPIWMYIVLTILLLGVWANYLYTIVNLFKIKKEGKQQKLDIDKENTE